MSDERLRRALNPAPLPSAPSFDAVLSFRRRAERLRPVSVVAAVLVVAGLAAVPFLAAPRTDKPASYAIALPTYTKALDPAHVSQTQFTAALAAPVGDPLDTWTFNLIPRTNKGDKS